MKYQSETIDHTLPTKVVKGSALTPVRHAACCWLLLAIIHSDIWAQETETDDNQAAASEPPTISEPAAQANNRRELPITLALSAGIQYDDNVTVDELDTSTNIGDFAATFDVDLGYEHKFEQGSELDLGYSLSQRSYFEETDFDLQIHTGSINFKHNFSKVDLGTAFYTTHAFLGGEAFLDIQQFSPYVSSFISRKLYFRSAYTYRDKSFDNNPGRDGDVHVFDVDFYYFLDGVRQYLVGGYRYENENTSAEEFDFNGHTFDVRYVKRFIVGDDKAIRVRADWRYELRNYDAITPSIGEIRDDNRHRLRLRIEYPLARHFDILFSYQYRNYSSNLSAVDFDDNRIETQLRYKL